MSELNYAQFDLLNDKIVIEDVAYDWTPDGWESQVDDYGVRGETVRTLTQTRKNIVQPARTGKNWWTYPNEQLTGSATNLYEDSRYIIRQAWQVSWNQAFMGWCMRDHLMTLYTLQKSFWLQYDDEMSRDCATLQAIDSSRKKFVTPTYPIAFYRSGDPEGQYSQDHLYHELRIDNIEVDWEANPYRIDHETGLVAFETAVPANSIVTLKYLWRAYVRIKEINLTQLAMAQHVYNGTVVFEQLESPRWVERFDEIITSEPCRECPDNLRVDAEAEECPGSIEGTAVRQSAFGGFYYSWDNPELAEVLDGQGAQVQLPQPADVSEQLIVYEFNLPTPGDRTKRLSRFVGTVHFNQYSDAQIDLVRLVYRDTIIGPNKADGSALTSAYSFEIAADELSNYQFDFDDYANGFFGIAVQVSATNVDAIVEVDAITLSACWEDTEEEEPVDFDCGCAVDGPVEGTVTNTVLTCIHREDTVIATGYDVPSDHYVHGVEVSTLVLGADKGCADPPTATAQVDVRLKLNTTPSTFSSWYTKSDQPVRVVDHAYLNYLDATTDRSWGGVNDCWGKPFGAWSPALINANGVKLEVKWDTACNPSAEANWSYARTYAGEARGRGISGGTCDGDFDTTWGPATGSDTEASMCCNVISDVDGVLSIEQEGQIIHTFLWVGAGDAPEFLDIDVWSKAYAGNNTFDPSAVHSQTANNGFNDPFVMDPSGQFGISEGTHRVRVNVVAGIAEYQVPVYAYAEQGGPFDPTEEYCSDARVYSSAEIATDACNYPELQMVNVVVHHSPVCTVDPRAFQEVTVTGWPTVLQGVGGGLAYSSDGGTNGAFTLLGTDFGFPTLGANSRIVGIQVTGEYRVTPSYARGGNLTLKAHIGSYSGARTGKMLAYPQTNEWTSFSVGGNGEFWDYSAVHAETSVTYPTATGAQVNSFFKLELIGDNDIGYVYEFRNIKVKLYYCDVCDGL